MKASNRLEKPFLFEWFIGRRYLLPGRRHSFVSLITLLSVAGVAVGVMALIVVIAVMAGFEKDLTARILGIESHVVVEKAAGPVREYGPLVEKILQIEGVATATPYIQQQVMLKSFAGSSGALLRGVDTDSAGDVLLGIGAEAFRRIGGHLTADSRQDPAKTGRHRRPGMLLGRQLAKNLSLIEGDTAYIVTFRGVLSPVGHLPAIKGAQVKGFFETGMFEYDGGYAFVDLQTAQQIFRMPGSVHGIELRVDQVQKADEVAEAIRQRLGDAYQVRDWMQMNGNLFAALKLEKVMMFLILGLVVLVAAFNIASALIMMVMEKTRDIAILKAMGATRSNIRWIFIYKGLAVGVIGTALGTGLGVAFSLLLQRYQFVSLPGEVFYIPTLPVMLKLHDVVAIVVAALLTCLLATLYPARQAAGLNPIEAIRYG